MSLFLIDPTSFPSAERSPVPFFPSGKKINRKKINILVFFFCELSP